MLANDLKEYGKGYSASNLKRMMRVASGFVVEEFSAQPASQIPWFTLIEIMNFADFFDETEIIQQPVGQIPWGTIIVIMQNLKHMMKLATNLVAKYHGEQLLS